MKVVSHEIERCSTGDKFTIPDILNARNYHRYQRNLSDVGTLVLRICWRIDLTYRSCQRSHRKDWMFDCLVARTTKATPRMIKIYLDSIWEKGVQDSLAYWGVEELYEP